MDIVHITVVCADHISRTNIMYQYNYFTYTSVQDVKTETYRKHFSVATIITYIQTHI